METLQEAINKRFAKYIKRKPWERDPWVYTSKRRRSKFDGKCCQCGERFKALEGFIMWDETNKRWKGFCSNHAGDLRGD
jgi:hypothetical protein